MYAFSYLSKTKEKVAREVSTSLTRFPGWLPPGPHRFPGAVMCTLLAIDNIHVLFFRSCCKLRVIVKLYSLKSFAPIGRCASSPTRVYQRILFSSDFGRVYEFGMSLLNILIPHFFVLGVIDILFLSFINLFVGFGIHHLGIFVGRRFACTAITCIFVDFKSDSSRIQGHGPHISLLTKVLQCAWKRNDWEAVRLPELKLIFLVLGLEHTKVPFAVAELGHLHLATGVRVLHTKTIESKLTCLGSDR